MVALAVVALAVVALAMVALAVMALAVVALAVVALAVMVLVVAVQKNVLIIGLVITASVTMVIPSLMRVLVLLLMD